MLIAFVIWSAVSLCFLIVSIVCRRSDKPVGVWANAQAPEVNDVKGYNRAVSNMWIVFAILLELLGLPLLLCEQNGALALLSSFGVMPLAIATMIVYTRIERKYRK